MKMQFILGDTGRKGLVKALSKILGSDAKYMGAPGFCYNVNGCIIDKDGGIDIPNALDANSIAAKLCELGFERKEESERSVISFSSENIDDRTLDNINKLISAKSFLIQKALNTDSLTVENKNGKLIFGRFSSGSSSDEFLAYTQFLEALVKLAKEQRRVTAKPCSVENEKYAFRCFLLRLGFIGKEYSSTRKILLSRLHGKQSYKEMYNTK